MEKIESRDSGQDKKAMGQIDLKKHAAVER